MTEPKHGMEPVRSVKGPWHNKTQPCARPGCGHDIYSHLDSRLHLSIVPGVPLGPDGCPCPSYRTQAQAEVDRLQARIKQAWEAADYGNEHGDSPRRTLDTVLRALGFPER